MPSAAHSPARSGTGGTEASTGQALSAPDSGEEARRLWLSTSRSAQQAWSQVGVRQRLKIIGRFRKRLAADGMRWARAIQLPQRRTLAESMAAEVVPLADACRFLQRKASELLAPRPLSNRNRPLWSRGASVTIHREPVGVVLVIGTWNYPLLLTGVQTLQAITAGNAVVIKPGEGSMPVARRMAETLISCGLDQALITVLDESAGAAQQMIDEGVDKIVFTGSAATGRKILQQAAPHLTPATLELSGSDAVFVRADADLPRVADCLAFGTMFNGGATCIAPRRLFVHRSRAVVLRQRLGKLFEQLETVPAHPRSAATASQLVARSLEAGARIVAPAKWTDQSAQNAFQPLLLETHDVRLPIMQADLFVPILTFVEVDDDEQAIAMNRQCPYALGASVFGTAPAASRMATQIAAGCVMVNDLIAPTADPRVPFGGWKQSGFGVTRGAEGLLEMTRLKAVVVQHSRWLPHLEQPTPHLEALLDGYLRLAHGGTLTQRIHGALDCIRSAIAHRKQSGSHAAQPPDGHQETGVDNREMGDQQ